MLLSRIKINNNIFLKCETGDFDFLLSKEITVAKVLSQKNPSEFLNKNCIEKFPETNYKYLSPLEDQDIWGAGVTYFNSKMARNQESQNKTTLYEYVYDSERPQLFYKSRGRNVIDPKEDIVLPHDSNWTVPEPELVLVINSFGEIVGYTSGNDVSCRDIEGENALFQPQAKIWDGGCCLGPKIVFCDSKSLKNLEIEMQIVRNNNIVFEGKNNTNNIIREFELIVSYLIKNRNFPDGTFLFTGTGIIPNEDFSLQAQDIVKIRIGKNNILENGVRDDIIK